ncbi:hypothetical protein [Agitococcus lubricus]|uniref:Uncharacterized protein n=1 Tax=Agitococcus lubricus TaxID=1077255 RepID=A0A2T5IZ69_9GAMM|nr:hypothetical protein [Agitococcus lubricus]PTQ89333.1 hypothetical protein C8N29_10766 [Agitococcus lubricus]
MKNSVLIVLLASLSLNVQAGQLGIKHRLHGEGKPHQRQNFSESATRTLANGEQITRETVQTTSENGFNRHSTLTNSAGQTATQDLTVVNDPSTGTHTRTKTGTTFKGKSYRHQRQVTVDKENQTATSTVNNTHINGQTTGHTSTHQWNTVTPPLAE